MYLLAALMRDRSVVLISVVGVEVCAVFEHQPQKHQSVLINIWCGPLCTQGSRVAAIGPFCSLILLSRLSKSRAFRVLQAASLKPRLAKLATRKVGRGRDASLLSAFVRERVCLDRVFSITYPLAVLPALCQHLLQGPD